MQITAKLNHAQTVEVAPGFHLPAGGTITARGLAGLDLVLTVLLARLPGQPAGLFRYRVVGLEATPGAADEVTGEALRAVPVATILREGIHRSVRMPRALDATWSGPENAGSKEPPLQLAAAYYALAYAVGEPPKRSVADALGVSLATAGRWISRARGAGHLPAVEEPA